MRYEPHNYIRQQIDAEFSFLDSCPSLHYPIMSQIKGESVVKKKISLGLVLVMILVLITGTVAFAVANRGVSWFLTEKDWQPISIDPDLLIEEIRQNHTSTQLEAAVVDAYWDGLELCIAYRVAPAKAGQMLRMKCCDPLHVPNHDYHQDFSEADLVMMEPDHLIITGEDDQSSYVTRLNMYYRGAGWVYEDDGSLTVMFRLKLYDLSKARHVGIPLHSTLTDCGETDEAWLHCYLPQREDPIAEHEHLWAPATCVSPATCSVCRREEGGLGRHDFQPAGDGEYRVCVICTTRLE